MAQRLQKTLSACGLGSRRACEKLIEAGRVTVNGAVASLGVQVETWDEIAVDGARIQCAEPLTYLMLHKPRGYITSGRDERGRKTVMELVSNAPVRVFPVGRLDMDSEGLLIMTNDGDLANQLMHPRYGHEKRYQVWVEGDLARACKILQQPIESNGELLKAKAIEQIAPNQLRFTLQQGKNRQIRRMCKAAGLTVTRLKRYAVGALELGELAPGTWRELSQQERLLLQEK